MDWEEALEQAKEKLGYSEQQCKENGVEWISTATEILEKHGAILRKSILTSPNEEGVKRNYRKYLKSERWKELKDKALERDHFLCIKCNRKAQVVHHKDYERLGSPDEIHTLVSLCHKCHKKIHEI